MQPDGKRFGPSYAQPDATVRMTVQEAAAALGVTVEAIRGRIHRGKYHREKTEDGRVFVVLSHDQLRNDRERLDERSGQRSHDQAANVSEEGHALVEDLVEDLAEELRQQVEFLKTELAARNDELRRREEEHREESRRKDHIIMSLTQRIPELEPAPEPRESPETASEGMEAPMAEERRSWWRRFFDL